MTQYRSSLAELVRQQRERMNAGAAATGDGELMELAGFGANPGALRMLAFLPEDLPPGAPLVVALHGCTQTAAGYDRGTGWSALAAEAGFAVLLPEQRQANNPNRCFNWFEPGDTTRGQGEVHSIHAAVTHLIATRGIDPAQVFVTGLSAGGAMASSLLATYPEVFAAGAIIAGLPHGAASSMPEAFEAMATGKPRAAADWAALVRGASRHAGPWPRVSVWQGDADTTVRPANAEQLIRQWSALHGTTGAPEEIRQRRPAHAGLARRRWPGGAGTPRHRRHVAWRADRGRGHRRGRAVFPAGRHRLDRGDRRLLRPAGGPTRDPAHGPIPRPDPLAAPPPSTRMASRRRRRRMTTASRWAVSG